MEQTVNTDRINMQIRKTKGCIAMKKNIRNIFAGMLAVALAVVLTTAALAPDKGSTIMASEAKPGKITVNGQGVIKVRPDVAYITLGVLTRDLDAKKAQELNSAAMTTVIAAIKAQGVADKDIKTAYYNMYPEYDYTEKEQRLTGYSVTNNVTVTVRDINAVGKIIDAGIAAGANNANSIQFGLQDSSSYYAQALGLAVANSKQKAAALAKALGVTIGNPVEVAESGSYYAPLAAESLNTRNDMASSAGASMPVQANELEVSANISCVFEY